MSALRFEVTYPDGSKELLQTDAERVLAGRGAHCEIRLPEGDYAIEHVAFEVVGASLRVVGLAVNPPPRLNGEPVAEAAVPDGAVLGIGGVAIRVTRVEGTPAQAAAKTSGGSAGVRVVGVLAAATLVWMLMIRGQRTRDVAPAEVPELWSTGTAACPVPARGQARALAAEKRIVADGKRERHPFQASDGVEAVALYETAAACFEIGGDAETAAELVATAEQLRADVIADFRVRRLRLERALQLKNDEVAAHEVVMLRTLMLDKQGPYIDWINRLARKLEVDKETP